MDGPKLRVVLLTKDIHLGHYLEARLRDTGCLVGVVHEIRLASFPEKLRYGWRTAKKEGLARTLDVTLGALWDATVRRRELARALEEILPIPGAAAGPPPQRLQVQSLNSAEARQAIAALAPDLIVVHATGILGQGTFSLARRLAVNIHCGVLPEYRGHASTFWAYWNGDLDNLGVTVHEVAKIVDTGRVLALGRVPYTPGDTDVTLWLRAFRLGVDLTTDLVRRMAAGEEPATIPLAGEAGPHYPRRSLSDYLRYRVGRPSPWRQRVAREAR